MAEWVNRAALIVRPRKPYLDWAAGLDDAAPKHAKGLEKRISIYLVGEDPEGKEETAPLKRYFKQIFETELAWVRIPAKTATRSGANPATIPGKPSQCRSVATLGRS
jgi:hypothetical protein